MIHDMDVQISHTGKRILYFQTEDRHVIRRAVDHKTQRRAVPMAEKAGAFFFI